jgi:ferrochelatase
MTHAPTDAVLLMAHGSPADASEIPEFLTSVRRGRPAPPAVVAAYEARYRAIGGRSPMTDVTRRIANALARRLERPVFLGTRHGTPTLNQALERIRHAGVRHLSAICLTPYAGRFTTGAYQRALTSARNEETGGSPHIDVVTSWCREPAFLAGLTATAKRGLEAFPLHKRDGVKLFFSAHSLPATVLEDGDPYPDQIAQTAAYVAAQLGLSEDRWQLAYQSTPDRVSTPWLGPKLSDAVLALSKRPDKGTAATTEPSALVVPIGFILDNLETLYDLDVDLQATAQSTGIQLERAPALNDHPLLIQALAGAVERTQRRGSDYHPKET